MNPVLIANIVTCVFAFIGFIYGMLRFFRPRKAVYAQMITLAVGYGMSFIKKRRNLFYCGTFALLTLASIYHGIFNMLVQSEYKYLGFILPALTYIPVVYYQVNGHKSKSV